MKRDSWTAGGTATACYTAGGYGGTLRPKIRKKVWKWRQLDKEGKYVEAVLNRFGVKSAANLKKDAQGSALAPSPSSDLSDEGDRKRPAAKDFSGKKQKQAKSPASLSSSGSSSRSSSSGSDNAARASEAAASVKKPPPAVISISDQKKPAVISISDQKKSTSNPRSSRADQKIHASGPTSSRTRERATMPSPPRPPGCSVIDVNIDCPEANREFSIFSVNDIQGAKDQNSYHFGYFICFPIEHRWYIEDENVEHYKARVFSNNQVLITVPSFDFTLLNNRDALVATNFPDYVIDAMDDTRHRFVQNRTLRQWKNILLQFPDDHTLKASVISDDAGEDEMLEFSMHPVEVKDEAGTVTKTFLFRGFTVARVDIDPHKRGKVEKKEKESKGARLLKNLVASKMGN